MDYNKVILVGRCGRDPEQREAAGKKLSSFSLATSYGAGDKAKTDWHQVTVWEKLSEIAQQIVHKGDRVLVEGRLSYNVVGEGEGKKQFAQITATNLINLTAKAAGETGNSGNGSTKSKTAEVQDTDIPF